MSCYRDLQIIYPYLHSEIYVIIFFCVYHIMRCDALYMCQIVLGILNVSLKISNKEDATVGPDYFYYFFIGIFPLGTLVFAQLYLTQSSTLRNHDPNFEALLDDYDIDGESMNGPPFRKAVPGLWTSDSTWSSSDQQSVAVRSSHSSGRRSGAITNSVTTGLRSSQKYRDPLLDFQYSSSSAPSGLGSDKSMSSNDSSSLRIIASISASVSASANSSSSVKSGDKASAARGYHMISQLVGKEETTPGTACLQCVSSVDQNVSSVLCGSYR